jgi:hypothetical protein
LQRRPGWLVPLGSTNVVRPLEIGPDQHHGRNLALRLPDL